MIRMSLIYMIIGMILGAGMFAAKVYPAFAEFWLYQPLHIEFLLIGWTLQLFLGMAYWILPRNPMDPIRGPEWMIWFVLIILNLGIIVFSLSSVYSFGSLDYIGRIFELLSFIVFVKLMWPRIRPFFNQPHIA